MNTVAVLVCSCDKYSDVWGPFFTLFRRYWPDCPYPVYLLSNTFGHLDHGVRNLLVGEDRDWTSNMKVALEKIPEQTVLIFMEDYFLNRTVETAKVQELASVMETKKWGYLRIFPVPGAEAASETIAGLPVGPLQPGAPYRVSLQLAFWTKDLLATLLLPGESAWQLELVGSRRSDGLPQPFYSMVRDTLDQVPIPYFCTAVEKGRWLPGALRLLKQEEVPVDLSRRGIQRPWHKWQRWVRHWGGQLYRKVVARSGINRNEPHGH
jgi:hypothetical protein